MYEFVVPEKNKKTNKIINEKKIEQESKKLEAKQRAEKVRTESNKIREINKLLVQKQLQVINQQNIESYKAQTQRSIPKQEHKDKDKGKGKKKGKDLKNRISEMGLEFILKLKPRELGNFSLNNISEKRRKA